MISEVTNRSEAPNKYVTFIVATFADGYQAAGTGSLVGRNDILTASHVVYDPDRGGYARNIELYQAVDFNFQSNRFESAPLISLAGASWYIQGWPLYAHQDDDHQTLTRAEAQYDIAIIGIDKNIGDQLGWFGLSPGYNSPQTAYQLGYPSDGTGMMAGQAWVQRNPFFSVYEANARDGSDIMGPGSSGGPLYVTSSSGGAQLIGVKTSGSDTASQWADIGLLYPDIIRATFANDFLLQPNRDPTLRGTNGNDWLTFNPGADRIDGGGGLDTLHNLNAFDTYSVERHAGIATLENLQDSAGPVELFSVERLQFSNGTLALDVGAGETSGSVYRLYQAAFARTPDTSGLNYWVGKVDEQLSIGQAAHYFVVSQEFQTLYGVQPSGDQLLTRYYQNVLDRGPDAEGYNYWMSKLDQGLRAEDMLVYFSESIENQLRVASVIDDGIWLG